MQHTLSKLVAMAAIIVVPAAAHAQVLEEVVVTAQKREQNIQDIGIAISAFSSEQISELGWTNAEHVAEHTPGLIATSYNNAGTISLFSIRGVAQTDFNDHQEAPTLVYLDGAYLPQTSAAGAAMFDMERVEVLKGPQGTLYGRNATGGLVHLITARPTNETTGYIDLHVAEHSRVRAEGALSGAFSENVQGRLSFLRLQNDSYFDNRIGEDLRETEATHLRAQLQAQLSDNWEANLSFHWGEFDNPAAAYGHRTAVLNADGLGEFGGPADVDFGGYVDNDGDFYAGDFGSPGPNDAEGWIATLNLEYHVGDSIRLVSVTNLQNQEKDYQEDSDSSPADFGNFLTQQAADDFAQEIRLEGSTDKLDWITGFYYLQIDGDYRVSFNFPDYFGYSIFPNNLYSLETTSWAAFGQLEYQLMDNLTLVAGVRWTEDDKDFTSVVTCDDFGPPPTDNGCDDFGLLLDDLSPFDLSRSDSDYTGKLQLDWAVSDDTLIYAGVNRGMKAGGFLGSIDAGATLAELEFEPEILHAFEVGFKTSFAEGRARLNGSAFFYDYEDYQAFVFQGITSVIVNRDAEITGAELELIAQPAEGWDLLLGVSLMDAPHLRVAPTPSSAGICCSAFRSWMLLSTISTSAVVSSRNNKWSWRRIYRSMFSSGKNGKSAGDLWPCSLTGTTLTSSSSTRSTARPLPTSRTVYGTLD